MPETNQPQATTLNQINSYVEGKKKAYTKALKNYRDSGTKASGDLNFGSQITPLLQQIFLSFETINSNFNTMSTFFGKNGDVTLLKAQLALLDKEVIDASVMSKSALVEFYQKESLTVAL